MSETPSNNDNRDKRYSATQLCHEFDLTIRALRFYEECQLLTPMRSGSTRIYTHRDRVRLKLVLRGKRFGFSLTEIGKILDLYETPNGRIKQLQFVLPKLKSQLHLLQNEHVELANVISELDSTCGHLADTMSQHMETQSVDNQSSPD